MARTFHFRLITREGPEYDGPAVYVRLRATDGYFGVMADHAPLVAVLVPGDLAITEQAGATPRLFAAGSGVVEVRDNEVTAVVETAETAAEIDLARAQAAAERARALLAGPRAPDVDPERAQAALERALARMHVTEES
jgi:F-type H+-transporting ATPase subunit epsilon